MSVVGRATGRSAVASAAYRCAERLENARDGMVHDYTRKEGVTYAEIVLPEGVDATWAKDRSALWNAAEAAEKRSDARVAREFVVALPHELSPEGRTELTRSFAEDLANRTGAVVDFAIHEPHRDGDVRNHHAHVLMTTREVTADGLAAKTTMELANKELLPRGLPTTQAQLVEIRRAWEGLANAQLAREGIDVQIDHRSHAERGLEIAPTQHMGVAATGMQRRGGDVERTRLDPASAERNAAVIRDKPEQVLGLITNEKSVFDGRDIARTLHRYVNDDAQAYRNALAAVMQSPALVTLQAEHMDPATGEVTPARYSTREMVEVERGMAETAERLHEARGHGIDRRHVERAMARQDAAIQESTGDAAAGLSDEQRRAVGHITGREGIAAVVGFAGAGKSTMLAAAREAWEAQGFTVHGAALSGKAAEGLEESSGIASRTLASWTHGWDNGHGQLGRGDVLVIDEAGMVGSRQLARFVGEAEKAGAKLVLVGDHEQLQAIGAGAPFRAVAERIGHAELSDIRRQREDWQRDASVAFATHRTGEGLAAYREHGAIQVEAGREEARGAIVRDVLVDREERPEGTRVAMAHRRADVRALNADIRGALQDRGDLARGEAAGERTYQTNDGNRSFVPGDRIVFLENDRALGVKNGMLGTVTLTEEGRLVARLDGVGRDGEARRVSVPTDSYQALDHGYATTIHKTQGATVDRSFVLASGTMDRHLTYVAMTRHRDTARLYAVQDEFAGREAGRLVEHGAAPYVHDPANRRSYFVTLETSAGERRTSWGADLERAMAEAKPAMGATIGLERTSEAVRLADGTATTRQGWRVRDAVELAYAGLEARLSRSGAKETVLDYPREGSEAAQSRNATQGFAERRGIAAAFGISSAIELRTEQGNAPAAERMRTPEAVRMVPAPARDLDASIAVERPRRSLFDGLKLGRDPLPGTTTPERMGPTEPAVPAHTPAPLRRGMFDGLRLDAGPRAVSERGVASVRESKAPERDTLAERIRPLSGYEAALDRYARAYGAADRQSREGLPVLEAQKRELHGAGEALDQARPGARAWLGSALAHDAETARAMMQLSGRERVGQLAAGVERERVALADPQVRADRFVQRWQGLQDERRALRGWQHDEARGKVEGTMRAMGQALERDPQVESLLRNRRQELGIGSNARENEGIGHDLVQSLTRGRSQSLGL